MVYSLSDKELLCDKCKFQIAIFGAHKGGTYCQSNGFAKILWHYVTKCPYFKYDKGQRHERLFDLESYPRLLK